MATNNSGKIPTPGHVIYDSRNDTSTGKKRAVFPDGGVSVAERARLFGTQVTAASSKTPRPAVNQPIKSNVVHQDRNYQQINKNIDRRPNNEPVYSTPQKVSHHHHQPPVRNDTRTKHEQPSPKITKQNPHSHHHSSTHYQPSSSYDNSQHVHSQQRKHPDESSSRNPSYQTSNYFQPIRDPLEVLLNRSTDTYYQHQMPMPRHNDATSLQPFDLGNLINRIQQDYLSNVQPYVSSVQFIENNRSLADIGFITPATSRKDYTRQIDDGYFRQGSSNHYDFIDTNGFQLYEKKPSKKSFNDNRYSSMTRRKHRTRYHDQASSPIHILETSYKNDSRRQLDNPPIPKPPSPPAESEEEETTTSLAEASKSAHEATTDVDATTDSESEEPSKGEPPEKPASTPSLSKPVNDTTSALPPTGARTVLPSPAVARKIESETEESGSESDSESETEEEEPKPKPKPSPATRSNNPLSTSGTPITRSANTPQINARAAPQRITTNDNKSDQPSEPSGSITSFDPEETGKSSSFGSKFKSIANKFRRK